MTRRFRRWSALRYFACNEPVVVGRAWTQWGADRLIARDQRRLQDSPAYRHYQWHTSYLDRSETWC